MAVSKKERRFWKIMFNMRLENYPEHHDHLNLRETDLDNEGLAFLCGRIKTVNRLDLDHCLIDDDGIKHISQIAHIEELRLKDVALSDAAIPDLNRLKTLRLLHLGGTQISCEGAAQLSSLTHLKTLLITPDIINKEAIASFNARHPECDLIINYKCHIPGIERE
ncbi:hypothetical protein [Echinicola vietnamensis]|uniref:Leucine Rich Repeat (LRR)-containing protein n=1 Tax=Echinicola vietnamensis (strain DSM 17526 / LMG 23754 / KMM 6221) TaxID=926556 RepID=L0FU54_ECHVK|nr:hypothetical protein [Echinicola vietnamensis]AGA76832.1 hypothetical protein Echvi_0553 [Echinicola vietnamensis DSM 17526]